MNVAVMRNRVFSVRLASAAGIWCALVVGCDSGEKLYHVSGKVTFRGQPVPTGLVFLDPDPAKGTAGIQGFASIKEGSYSTAENGQGVRGGAYVVRVLGFDGKAADEAPFGQALFTEYSTTKDIPESDTVLDFALPVP